MIEVTNLTKYYGSHRAVCDISFKIEKGLIYGFLGPNGAGKTTVMNIMTGYIGASGGKVLVNGYDIVEDPENAKRCIGYLPEQPPLYVDMTVLEYLNFAADLKKVPKDKAKAQIDELLDIIQIRDVKNRLIKFLSKGYRQRVGLAQAIIGYPDIIILDEPTVGLDPRQIIDIRNLIKSLGEKHTVILSSHILSEISAVCDYVLILSHGRLVASDTPENLGRIMKGTNIISLTAKGTESELRGVLSNIQNITKLSILPIEGGFIEVDVESPIDVDLRENVFYALSGAKCPIMALSTRNISLEETFLELTKSEGAPNDGNI